MSEQETRIALDGKHYTWDQFAEYYPDDTDWYWDEAEAAIAIAPAEDSGGMAVFSCSRTSEGAAAEGAAAAGASPPYCTRTARRPTGTPLIPPYCIAPYYRYPSDSPYCIAPYCRCPSDSPVLYCTVLPVPL